MKKHNIRYHNQPRLPFDDDELAIDHTDHARQQATETDLIYLSLGSGSSGNSCYIGTRHSGILIDAGIPAEQIAETLENNGLHINNVHGLLLTHDHFDHVKYAYNVLRKHRHIHLFCTNRVMTGLLRRHSISKRIKEYHRPIFKEIPFTIADITVTAFDVPHDGTDNMGFYLEFHNHRFALATDLGAVTDRARYYMSKVHYLVIEANYDLDMLLAGKYPEYLKARIQTERGHMDNRATAEFLKEYRHPLLKYIFLCHLSQDNNTPAIALKTVRETLEATGLTVGDCSESLSDRAADIHLTALPRFEASSLFTFHNPDEIPS